MAKDIIGKISIDAKDFLNDVQKCVDFTKELENEFQTIAKAKSFDNATKDSKALGESLKKTLATMIVEGKEGTAEFKKLESQLKQVTAESKKFDDALKKVATSVDDIGKEAQKSGGALDSIFQGIGAGAGIGIATAGIELLTSAFTESVVKGKELADAQTDLARKTGLSGEAFNKLKVEAKDAFVGGVGESVAEATKVVATARNLFGDAIPIEQIGEIASKAQTLGRLYDKDVNEVLMKSQSFIKQFGLEGDKAFNLIALAQQKGGTSQDDVLDTFAEYSQLFVEAGFNAEEFAGILVQAGEDAQFGTDKIADSIKEAQIRLKAGDTSKAFGDFTNLPKDLKKNLDKALKDAEQGKISVKDFLQISGKEIEKGFKEGKITESVRTQLQVAIAGTPAEDIGSEFYGKVFGTPIDPKIIEEQAKKAGSTFNKAVSFDSVIKEITGTIQLLSADVIKILEPAFATIVGIFSQGNSADGLINGIKGLASAIASILPTVAVFLKASFDLSQIFTKTLLSAIQKFASNFSGVFGNTQNEGVSFFETISEVGKTFGDVIGSIVDIVSTYIGALGTVWGSVFGSILGNYSETEKGTTSFSDKVVSFAQITSAVVKDWANKFNGFMASIKPVLSDVGNFIGTLAKYIGTILKGAFDLIVGSVTATVNVFKFFGSVISSIVTSVNGFVNSLFGASTQTNQTSGQVQQATGFFADMGRKITEVGGVLNFFSAILNGVSFAFANFSSGIAEGFKLISSGEISKGFDALFNSVSKTAESFTLGFNKSVEESKNRLGGLANEGKKTADILGGLGLKNVIGKATEIPEDKIVPPPVVPPPTTGKATKETESELKKQQKAYEEALADLTDLQSDYSKKVNAIDLDLTLSTEQRAKKKLDLDIELANQKVALVRKIFKLEGDGITSLSTKVKLEKGEEFRTIQKIFEAEFVAKQKLEADKIALQKKSDEEKTKNYLKYIESLINADEKQFDRFLKTADELAGIKIGDTLTRQLIEDLQLEGVEIGSKVDESSVKKATEKAKESYQIALSDIDVQISAELNQQTKQNLIDKRKEIQSKLDNIEINLKAKAPKKLEDSVDEFKNKIVAGLSGITFSIDTSESKKAMKEIEKSIADVNLQFALGKLSSSEYQDQLNELNAKQKEVLDSQETVLDSLQKQLQGVFKSTTDITDQLLKDTASGIKDGTKTMADSFGALGLSLAGVVGGALTETEDKGTALLKGLFDLASKAVSILLPVILAQYSAFKGPIGTALATVLTAGIVATLQGIKSALGFEKGGLVPGGEQFIRINEKGQEFVINANATRKNMPVLDAINKGNDKLAMQLLQSKYDSSTSNSTIVIQNDSKLIEAVNSLNDRLTKQERALNIKLGASEIKFDTKAGAKSHLYVMNRKAKNY